MKRLSTLALIVLGLSYLGGCATAYNFNGHAYASASKALSAQREGLEIAINNITPANSPMRETVTIACPSREKIRRDGVKISGKTTKHSPMANYIVDITDQAFRFHVTAIKRSNIFENVITLPDDSKAEAAKATGARFFIDLDFTNGTTTITDFNSNDTRRIPRNEVSLEMSFKDYVDEIRKIFKLWGIKIQ